MPPSRSAFACTSCSGSAASSKPFDAMNGIAASLLLGVTSSVRFEGSLNVDLNEITNNLVRSVLPFHVWLLHALLMSL